jgi:fluoride ion exporter CrcB/FEX
MEEDQFEPPIQQKYILFKNWFNHILQYFHLTLFCCLGVSLRYVLSEWHPFGKNFDKNIISNGLGSFVIGFISELKNPILSLSELNIYQLSSSRFLTGITTGFCGSLTTFSSWQNEAILDFHTKNYANYLMKQISGISICILFFQIGKEISKMFLQFSSFLMKFSLFFTLKDENIKNRISNIFSLLTVTFSILLDISMILLTLISISFVIWLITISNVYGIILLSAPFGCIFRYHICLYNKKLKEDLTTIPFYTMNINVVGVFLISICTILEKSTGFLIIFILIKETKQFYIF